MTASATYDLLILGAGPGGYVCAIRAAQLGKKVALVEKRAAETKGGPALGGTCLNVGCIPSKALLDSSEHFHNARYAFAGHGIVLDTPPRIDVPAMMKRKDKVVKELGAGIAYLMKKNKIEVIPGHGRLLGGGKVQVGDKTVQAKDIVLAMGSTPIILPNLPVDGEKVITSDHGIALTEVPKQMVVVGGGAIGLELGSVWARLGAQVTVIEAMDQICAGYDKDLAGALQKSLGKLGMIFHLGAKVTGIAPTGTGVAVLAQGAQGEALRLDADKVLVAVGRRPVTAECGLDAAGVTLDQRGRITVDAQGRTSAAGVWAIGDLVTGPMLAHKAEEEGIAVAESIAGQHGHVDHALIPGVVYTWPELAMVGISEDKARAEGKNITVGRFAFQANGRAKAAGETDGHVKVIADAQTDQLLGVAILGPRASDLIAEAVTVMAFGGSAEDLALTCHAHPTFSEAVKEAALDSQGRIIHG